MFLAAVVFVPVVVPGADVTTPLHALLITGGCCHDYDNQKLILTQGISARANVSWTILQEGGTDSNHKVSIYSNANWAAGYDIIVHDECFAGVTDNAFINGIAAAHSNGVPAVMLHCSIHSYRDATTDEWRKCLGITSHSHEVIRDIVMTNVFPSHPIMRGFPTNWTDPADEL
ncbi:MAG: hypothetical protein HY301_17105 [Verrucomicrobia bacterium]|nr:hypothetical protein [Verrucomicrobiota bacterium]